MGTTIQKTPHYGLNVISDEDNEVFFRDWRNAIAGNTDNSNMMKIDTILNGKADIDKVASLVSKVANEQIDNSITYKLEILSSHGNMFKNGNIDTVLMAVVYKGQVNVTDNIAKSRFKWTRKSMDSVSDESWNEAHSAGARSIAITKDDVHVQATFTCSLLDETTAQLQ